MFDILFISNRRESPMGDKRQEMRDKIQIQEMRDKRQDERDERWEKEDRHHKRSTDCSFYYGLTVNRLLYCRIG